MTDHPDYAEKVFARGFILSSVADSQIRQRLIRKPYAENLNSWTHTFFGPYTLWVDPLLNYARVRDNTYGVGVLGLCINPFDGLATNSEIAEALYNALKRGRTAFYDYVDQLSGAFVIIYRENADVFVLQDTAATKPVYYHQTTAGETTVSSHTSVVQYLHDLAPDPRAQAVYESDIYRKDPSRYLPGMVTPFADLLPLTANNELDVKRARSHRFFPRGPLEPRPFDDAIVAEISAIMVRQAKIIGQMGRPLRLAATGGRDSRVSAATFSGQPNLQYYSFHMPSINHLTDDVIIARKLANIEQIPLDIYELETYKNPTFNPAFRAHSPRGIWPGAAHCYLTEFSLDTIHIRSTVSEIGRVFYSHRPAKTVSAATLAKIYTRTDFKENPMVLTAMQDFIDLTEFETSKFFNYSLYDMFYWEHRNSKWQNILCSEAEMATDVFIPFNNRSLLKLFMSIPFKHRQLASIHLALCDQLKPAFKAIEIV